MVSISAQICLMSDKHKNNELYFPVIFDFRRSSEFSSNPCYRLWPFQLSQVHNNRLKEKKSSTLILLPLILHRIEKKKAAKGHTSLLYHSIIISNSKRSSHSPFLPGRLKKCSACKFGNANIAIVLPSLPHCSLAIYCFFQFVLRWNSWEQTNQSIMKFAFAFSHIWISIVHVHCTQSANDWTV